jgi:hypothetical protein
MEELARQIGWYLSVAIFSILVLAIGGWVIVTTWRFIRHWYRSIVRRFSKKN